MKVLIISHNPMALTSSIGKTLISLFSEFKKNELCQLYIHTGVPSEEKCASYYQITDKDVLKGMFKRCVSGREQYPFHESFENGIEEGSIIYKSTYGSKNNRKPYREILRDTMWQCSPWYTKNLKNWIKRENPTHIFVAIGSSKFLYEMAIRISKDFSIPLITYVCDDFYSMETPNEFLGSLWKKTLVKKTQQLMENTNAIVSICDEMTGYYAKEFSKQAITVMTGTNYDVKKEIPRTKVIKKICYFGKLSLNRYQSMADLCRVVDSINLQDGMDVEVHIYCGSIDDAIKEAFIGINCAKIHGFISGKELETTFFESDALIHVEAFDEKSVDRVKNSVSTKIADSLASGIPLFTYAPKGIASVGHLLRNDCSFIATDKKLLEENMRLLINNPELRVKISKQALRTAEKYHNPTEVSNQLYKFIKTIG